MIDPLDQLMADILPVERAVSQSTLPKQAVAKVNYSHDAMIDLIITDPGISQNTLAARFGYSASWVSQVMASDAFQSKLAERTKELVDPTIRQTVENRFKALVIRSLEIIAEKLNAPSNMIPDQLALRALELSSRAAGYGVRDPVVAPQEVHQHLHILQENLVGLLHKKKAEAGFSEAEIING